MRTSLANVQEEVQTQTVTLSLKQITYILASFITSSVGQWLLTTKTTTDAISEIRIENAAQFATINTKLGLIMPNYQLVPRADVSSIPSTESLFVEQK